MYSLLIFFHILLLVFWLGTDLGVFLAAKVSERAELSVETRATVLKVGMVLDRLPRTALTLIIPSGLSLAALLNLAPVSDLLLIVAWAGGLSWATLLWVGFLNPETPTEQRIMILNLALNAIFALVISGWAIWWLTGDAVPNWLALKLLSVGLIFVAGVLLDVLFKPAVEAFLGIVTEGASDERNAAYSRAIGPVYWAVLAIYVLVLAAAWLGVDKPAI
ncbi:MAG: hypothetical protein AAGA23_02905 [Pseudomonadota bacterium]